MALPQVAVHNNGVTRQLCDTLGIEDLVCAGKRFRGPAKLNKKPVPLGVRWPIERTNLAVRSP